MSEHDRNTAEQAGTSVPAAGTGRKPYAKPTFRSEQVFETMALQCGKIQGTSGACNLVRQNS